MNRFRLRRFIGRGGMGEIYEAESTTAGSEGKPVALKIMRNKLRGQERYTALFHREARINLDISHEHRGLVTVFGHFEDKHGQLCIVMDLISGCSLHALLKEHRQLPLGLILYIAAEMLDAIDYMHRLGYLHLDISPSNVLLTTDGRVKISDLGLAKFVPVEGAPSSHVAKPPYASPEVLRRGMVDTRSDLYSFAALVYQMATGEPPFGRKHGIQDILARLADWQSPPLDCLPAELRALIGDMFHDNPDDRAPQSARGARDMLPELATMQTAREQLAAMVEPLDRRAHRESLQHNVPQLCFDVPFVVQRDPADLLGDTQPDSHTSVDTGTLASSQSMETAGDVVDASLVVSGAGWASDEIDDDHGRAHPSTDVSPASHGPISTIPTLPGRHQDSDPVSPTSMPISGSLRTQEVLMDPVKRFLGKLASLISSIPMLRVDGFVPVEHDDLSTYEADITLLYRFYDELSVSDRAKIEPEWVEFQKIIDNVNAGKFKSHDLYDQLADKLGTRTIEEFENAPTQPLRRQGKTRLAVVRNDSDSDAVPRAVAHEVWGDEASEEVSAEPPLVVLKGDNERATTPDDEGEFDLNEVEVDYLRVLYIAWHTRLYGRPPDEFANAPAEEIQETSGERGHLQLVPDLPADPPPFVEPMPVPKRPFVGPVSMPGDDEPKAKGHRLAAYGATFTAVAALALVLFLPEKPVSKKPFFVNAPTTITLPLLLEDGEYEVCVPTGPSLDVEQPEHDAMISRQTPAVAIPERHRTAKERFINDVDTVVLKRTNKPNLRVTVTEERTEDSPETDPSERVRVLELEHHRGTTVEINADDDLRLTWEVPR